jgi:hypothetical protein
MIRLLTLAVVAVVVTAGSVSASDISGQYVEARTTDIWTGPCFANADYNLTGKHAAMAWRIEKGSFDNVALDGLSIVAVIASSDTLGLEQTGPAQAVVIVDSRASAEQKAALVKLAQKQGGALLKNIVAVQAATIKFTVCECQGETCAELDAGSVKIRTRCLTSHDKACGNEIAYFPPLAAGVHVRPAAAIEHVFNGTGLNQVWRDCERRGAYVGTFSVR